MKQATISIIIIHYKADDYLYSCLDSIKEYKVIQLFETIVIDNDENPHIQNYLEKHYPWVTYKINPQGNTGFGKANNLGSYIAKGKYLFFLNPDTRIFPNTLIELLTFLETTPYIAAVAPTLLNKELTPYLLQGTKELTPLHGIIALSFINNIFPKNPISAYFWDLKKNRNSIRDAEVLPGTAFMMEKKLFLRIEGFDENFFLYFEENDLFNRLKKLQLKSYIIPQAKVLHHWGKSTELNTNSKNIFKKSRFYYFKKNYGFLSALLVEFFTSFGKEQLGIVLILLLGAVLLFFRLSTLMPFIGDQAWFYLSARDMLLYHTIPLVGITSSHTWLHQGPLWTYVLAGIFAITRFNPLAPGYFSALLTCFTVYVLYKVGKTIFSPKVGILASILFATSPLVIINGRMPFCTVPIPLFVLLFIFSLYKFVNNSKYAFFLCIFLLSILYNLEIATSIFIVIFLMILLWGMIKKATWIRQISSLKFVTLSLLTGIIPMIPMILYDRTHGYPQTVKFAGWFIVHIINIVIPIKKLAEPTGTIPQMFSFVGISLQKILFIPSELVALLLFIFATIYIILKVSINLKNKKNSSPLIIIAMTTFIPLVALIGSKTPSDAYLPMLFPGIILIISIFLERVYSLHKITKLIIILCIIILTFFNSYSLISHNYYMQKNGYGLDIATRENAAKKIIKMANKKPYILKATGPGSEFESMTMNYLFLTWYYGTSPSKNAHQIITYSETLTHYTLTKELLPHI